MYGIMVMASADGHSDSYQHVVEELNASDSKEGATVNPLVRADMIYFETPNNGAVFSTGSIDWVGAPSHNNYQNSVSKVTENVMRKFRAQSDCSLLPHSRKRYGGKLLLNNPLED
jgi:N,N-dimethylformamidase